MITYKGNSLTLVGRSLKQWNPAPLFKLKITLTTHAAGGLTDNDFIMAGIIDELRGGG